MISPSAEPYARVSLPDVAECRPPASNVLQYGRQYTVEGSMDRAFDREAPAERESRPLIWQAAAPETLVA